jgi:hypothetical protein
MKRLLVLLGAVCAMAPLYALQTTPTTARAKKVSAVEAAERDKAANVAKDKARAFAGKAPSESELEGALKRGTLVLLESQEAMTGKAKAEWPYEGVYRVEGEIPIGYRVGGTAICAGALLDASAKPLNAGAVRALGLALDFVLANLKHPLMSVEFVGKYDTRGWGHAYALEFLLKLRAHEAVPPEQREQVDVAVRSLIDTLQKTAIGKQGGWQYARGDDPNNCSPSPFMTAPTLQILFEARRQGETVDDSVLENALTTLESARDAQGSVLYSSPRGGPSPDQSSPAEGATGRMAVCETTLFLAGRGSVERIRAAVDAFFEHWEWLEIRRRQNGTHVAPFGVAPYYYFYAHRYAAQAIEFLPEAERTERREQLYKLLWSVRERSGGWNDRVFPRSESYGTAMTMLSLREPHAPRPARWTPTPTETK